MSATASCRFPFLDEWKDLSDKNKICGFGDSALSGYAQIAFNDNIFSGILMIIATWIGSPVQCISAVWATIIATVAAYASGVPVGLIRCGLYGFNATLAGLAVPLIFFPNQGLSFSMLAVSTVAAVLCVLLTTFCRKIFEKWDVPALSAPYCCAMFLLAIAALLINVNEPLRLSFDSIFFATSLSDWSLTDYFAAILNGAAQILWVEKPVCGILYMIALLFASRTDAVNAITASIVSTTIAVAIGFPKDAVIIGLFGYNSILLMQVFSRGFRLSVRSHLFNIAMAALTPIVCALFKLLLTPVGLGAFLAFPYVTLCILAFLLRNKLKGFQYIPGKYWGVPETIMKTSM